VLAKSYTLASRRLATFSLVFGRRFEIPYYLLRSYRVARL
jgi:hypothetical protein